MNKRVNTRHGSSVAILAQGRARAVWCFLVTRLISPWNVAALVIILYGELLRTCSSVVQEHFQGLAQAGLVLPIS